MASHAPVEQSAISKGKAMSETKTALQLVADYKRSLLNAMLEQATDQQRNLFAQMYVSVEAIPELSMDWALKQCERTKGISLVDPLRDRITALEDSAALDRKRIEELQAELYAESVVSEWRRRQMELPEAKIESDIDKLRPTDPNFPGAIERWVRVKQKIETLESALKGAHVIAESAGATIRDQERKIAELEAQILNAHGALPAGWVYTDSLTTLDLLVAECSTLRTEKESLESRLSACELRPEVKVTVGNSSLTRDLVWCECGRGLSTYGYWNFCPNCGGKIDQESYRAACNHADTNGADKVRRWACMEHDKELKALGACERDKLTIDWLQEQIVDTIYLDDGRIIDVKGNSLRKAVYAHGGPSHE